MKHVHLLPLCLLLVACPQHPEPARSNASPVRAPQPEIAPAVDRLDAPSRRINEVNSCLRDRIAFLEKERALLRAEAATWEEQMAKWTERGLTTEQKLEITLGELKKVRANWFDQLDVATAALQAQVDELTAAHAQLESEKTRLKAEAAIKDQEVRTLVLDKEADARAIAQLEKLLAARAEDIRYKDRKIDTQATLLKLALIPLLYMVLRIIRLTPAGKAFLFWLP